MHDLDMNVARWHMHVPKFILDIQMTRFSKVFAYIFAVCLCSRIFSYPDFENSIVRGGQGNRVIEIIKSEKGETCRNFEAYKRLYEKNIQIVTHSSFKTPPIIHQIWIGKPMPEVFQMFIKTWQGWCGWEYKLWTDEEIEKLPMINRDLYIQATNPGEKADIARLEILRLYGGIYVDVDFECINRLFFYELARKYTFVLGIEPVDIEEGRTIHIGNAFMAAAPFHPLTEELIAKLQIKYNIHTSIVDRTGPGYLARIVPHNLHLLFDSGIILPSTFLYPVWNKAEIDNLDFFIKPETAAIHYWSGSWVLQHPRNLDTIKESHWQNRSERIFSEIYRSGLWAKDEWGQGTSGAGSSIQEGRPFIEFVQNFLAEHEIRSIVDVGCGDWNLAKEIDWGQRSYIGIDIVSELILRNQKKYGSEKIQFIKSDIVLDPLPAADLLICKDVLMHLSFSEIFNVLNKLSDYKHCILVHDIDIGHVTNNQDIEAGGFRHLDLTVHPFNVKKTMVYNYFSHGSLKQVIVVDKMERGQ